MTRQPCGGTLAEANILIYGKGGCPHTRRALEAMPDARFVDVLLSAEALDEMLRLTGGIRRVPVVVRQADDSPGPTVEIGYRRGA